MKNDEISLESKIKFICDIQCNKIIGVGPFETYSTSDISTQDI